MLLVTTYNTALNCAQADPILYTGRLRYLSSEVWSIISVKIFKHMKISCKRFYTPYLSAQCLLLLIQIYIHWLCMCTCIRPMNIKSTDHELAFTHAKGLNAYMSYRILENWMLQCLNYSSPSPGLPLATTCTSLGTRPLNSACTQSQVCTTHFMTTLRLSTALWSGV